MEEFDEQSRVQRMSAFSDQQTDQAQSGYGKHDMPDGMKPRPMKAIVSQAAEVLSAPIALTQEFENGLGVMVRYARARDEKDGDLIFAEFPAEQKVSQHFVIFKSAHQFKIPARAEHVGRGGKGERADLRVRQKQIKLHQVDSPVPPLVSMIGQRTNDDPAILPMRGNDVLQPVRRSIDIGVGENEQISGGPSRALIPGRVRQKTLFRMNIGDPREFFLDYFFDMIIRAAVHYNDFITGIRLTAK